MNKIKNEFLLNATTSDMLEFAQLIGKSEDNGLLVEIVHTALHEIKNNPKTTPLLALQIAVEDWEL